MLIPCHTLFTQRPSVYATVACQPVHRPLIAQLPRLAPVAQNPAIQKYPQSPQTLHVSFSRSSQTTRL